MSVIYRLINGYYVEPGFWIFIFLLLIVSFVVAFFVFFIGLITKKNNKFKIIIKIIFALLLTTEFLAYLEDAHIRANFDEEKCSGSLSPDGLYFGKKCQLGVIFWGNDPHLWLMIYDAKTMTLLKEGDAGVNLEDIHWGIGENGKTISAHVDMEEDGLILKLPPTWLDKIRAKLP
jgi:hypothetical protein